MLPRLRLRVVDHLGLAYRPRPRYLASLNLDYLFAEVRHVNSTDFSCWGRVVFRSKLLGAKLPLGLG